MSVYIIFNWVSYLQVISCNDQIDNTKYGKVVKEEPHLWINEEWYDCDCIKYLEIKAVDNLKNIFLMDYVRP